MDCRIAHGKLDKGERLDIRDGQLIVSLGYLAQLVATTIRENRLTDSEREEWFKQRALRRKKA
jgi:hypothetical protein